MNDKLVKQVVDALFERVNQLIIKKINNTNVELSSIGIITEVSSDNTLAKVDVGFAITDDIPNCSGETLAEGCVVKIYYDKPDMQDAYIGVRLKYKEANA